MAGILAMCRFSARIAVNVPEVILNLYAFDLNVRSFGISCACLRVVERAFQIGVSTFAKKYHKLSLAFHSMYGV